MQLALLAEIISLMVVSIAFTFRHNKNKSLAPDQAEMP